MQVNAPKAWSFELDNLTVLIGRYFQVRDDYSNLSSPDYAVQKGFCEDLDEGKFSFPIVHALNIHDVPVIPELVSFVEKKIAGCGHLSKEQKVLVLEALDKSGSFEYTRNTMKRLFVHIEEKIERLEEETGLKNYILRLLVKRLQV